VKHLINMSHATGFAYKDVTTQIVHLVLKMIVSHLVGAMIIFSGN
jgi:hypothetical protein